MVYTSSSYTTLGTPSRYTAAADVIHALVVAVRRVEKRSWAQGRLNSVGERQLCAERPQECYRCCAECAQSAHVSL